jgi:hypothetical protein
MFETYKAAAVTYRSLDGDALPSERRRLYAELEHARTSLTVALGYDRVRDHLGEYVNLHERDIPNCRAATQLACGRWSYSGFHNPVTRDDLDARLARHEVRSLELEQWFTMPSDDRFIAGAQIRYTGLRNGTVYTARYVSRAEVPYIEIREVRGFDDCPVVASPLMAEHEARSYFRNIPDARFVQ